MAATHTPRRPYLVRAMHEWMTANNQTPHLVVDASSEAAEVPRAFVRDGRITLNVSTKAQRHEGTMPYMFSPGDFVPLCLRAFVRKPWARVVTGADSRRAYRRSPACQRTPT